MAEIQGHPNPMPALQQEPGTGQAHPAAEPAAASLPHEEASDPVPVLGKCPGVGHCRVIGCNADTTSQTLTNVRYSICQQHRVAPALLVNGELKRFCGQMLSFRLLPHFDRLKRTCRDCLLVRNQRRKAQRGMKRKDSPGYDSEGCDTPPSKMYTPDTAVSSPVDSGGNRTAMPALTAAAAMAAAALPAPPLPHFEPLPYMLDDLYSTLLQQVSGFMMPPTALPEFAPLPPPPPPMQMPAAPSDNHMDDYTLALTILAALMGQHPAPRSQHQAGAYGQRLQAPPSAAAQQQQQQSNAAAQKAAMLEQDLLTFVTGGAAKGPNDSNPATVQGYSGGSSATEQTFPLWLTELMMAAASK